jgi:hydroxymethylglutaryl-CoA reductase
MGDHDIISGFSRFDREKKLKILLSGLNDPDEALGVIESYRHPDSRIQRLHEKFSENTITNFFLPYSVAPNFLINDKPYIVPMVTEESSVVAAAANSAKFWFTRGGFRTEVKEVIKSGHVHFIWNGDKKKLVSAFPLLKDRLLQATAAITSNMEKRGGGIKNIELVDRRKEIEGYYQLSADFDTRDSMGANFINTCLEEFSRVLSEFFRSDERFGDDERNVDIVMAILSNYSDKCLVTARVSCSIDQLGAAVDEVPAHVFAQRFSLAVNMAGVDVHRAATHNKGIFNGIDAVLIATGNDFRAVESAGHAWAAKDGRYRSLSFSEVSDGRFTMSLTLPVAVGTVGGMTRLHPMARLSLNILGNPLAPELMGVIAACGLATNFAAVRSLVTGGIQEGHMKLHLANILSHLNADDTEIEAAAGYFKEGAVGYAAVGEFLEKIRNKSTI